MASSTHTFRSRDEYRKAKELEEARKAGTVAPEVDEEGNDINPHIPQYISKAPWYLNSTAPSLKHQKSQKEAEREKFDKMGAWYARGETVKGSVATKYRKGACANCGSMTHNAKSCIERPRKRGAKFSNKEIRPDEVIREVNLDFEGKRDRWNGYDTRDYKRVIDEANLLEEERKKLKAAQMEQKLATGEEAADSSESENDEQSEFRLKGESEVILQQKDEATPQTIRNLRIREDTAKYLLNLDVNSAYYDPKTRSMRKDPHPNINVEDKDYAGDNFVRFSGDVQKLGELELHAIKATDEGRQVPHLQSDPSLSEMLYKQYKEKKENLESKRQSDILNRYGGEEYKKVDKNLMLEQSEVYIEYSRDGRVIKGPEPAIPRSKYPEDILENNHKMIWGSYYDKRERRWGYGCCFQTVRNSYCTGEEGKAARLESAKEMEKRSAELQVKREAKQKEQLEAAEKEKKKTPEELEEDRKRKVKDSMKRQLLQESFEQADDRKRGYNSFKGVNDEVTEEDMEAYRLRKVRHDDPMAKFLSNEEI